jgi:long-chain fatty acid transport protein
MTRLSTTITKISLLSVLAFSYHGSTFAAGFRIPEISTLGTGTSNALVANDTELGALAYNPAAMSFHSGKGLNAGILNINYDLDVTTAGTNKDSTGEDTFYVPNLYLMASGNNNMSFGLAINAPFGLETGYKAGTFPLFTAIGAPIDGLEPALSRIKMVNINPNIAFKIDDTASFAFGVDYYHLKDLVFNTQAVSINGAGSGFGMNLGYLKKAGNWNFGISYHNSVSVDLKGSMNLTALGGAPMAAFSEVEFPDLLQIGASYKVNDALTVELDVERTGWSSFGEIDIKSSDGVARVSSTNNWKDTTGYKLGIIYKLNPTTKLLFGYATDETPQTDDYFSARVPDNDRKLYSLGVTHDLGNMTVEASYMKVDIEDREVNQPAGSYITRVGAGNYDPNGTDAFNGDFNAGADVLALGLSMKF